MGLTPHTLRYYEKEGLIQPHRESNNRRYYNEHDANWIAFVIKLKETGMPIKQIQCYAELRAQGEETIEDRMRMLESHYQYIKQQLEKWQDNLLNLKNKIKYYQQMLVCKNNDLTSV